MTDQYIKIPLYWGFRNTNTGNYPTTKTDWKKEMAEMLRSYFRGEPVYISFKDEKREGSIARLYIENVQALLGNAYTLYRHSNSAYKFIEEVEENVKEDHFDYNYPYGYAKWDGRSNRVTMYSTECFWLKGYTDGTVCAYEAKPKPKLPAIIPKDRLDREIKVGDFIAYILYQFQGSSAAGIYFGKVTKITHEGEVYAKNIKLKDDDRQAEKKIKESKLVTIMSEDLMQQLMLAKLSSI